MTYDPHKKYKRVGECNHCGVCCVGCQFQKWKAVRDIKLGETIDSPIDFISRCLIHDHPEPNHKTVFLSKGCDRFPPHPLSTPEKCSFKWVEE